MPAGWTGGPGVTGSQPNPKRRCIVLASIGALIVVIGVVLVIALTHTGDIGNSVIRGNATGGSATQGPSPTVDCGGKKSLEARISEFGSNQTDSVVRTHR